MSDQFGDADLLLYRVVRKTLGYAGNTGIRELVRKGH